MRADKFLVSEGFFETRARAVAAIKAGTVICNGHPLTKPSQTIPDGAVITAEPAHPWVSRGGIKLAYALNIFKVDVVDRIALDVGASTGGFTDVLLSRGATKVYAVDVGHGQLHAKMRAHPNVVNLENTDARTLHREMFTPLPDIIVCDASFISLSKLLAPALSVVDQSADLITLVKPQFEVGRANIGKGGLVKSAEAAEQALQDVVAWISSQGWDVQSTDISPIKGGSGNSEFLLWARKA